MTLAELDAYLLEARQGMQDSDQLNFSITDTQQQPEQSSHKRGANQSDGPKKQNKRRKFK